jgi:hypothetical protein
MKADALNFKILSNQPVEIDTSHDDVATDE